MIRKVVLFTVVMVAVGAAGAYAAFPPIDLTTLGASVGPGADGVIWSESITAPTGTGVYNPFLRVQASPTEQGFNTDFGGPADLIGSHKVPLDDVSGVWTRSIQLQNIGTVNVGGIDYYQFTLDINEPNGSPANFLSLDQVQIYTVAAGSGNNGLSTWAQVQTLGTLRYDMDGGPSGNQEVYLDANLQQGSGHDDMQMLIPVTKFTGAAGTDYLYFYSAFGNAGGTFDGTSSADGFEEWHALQGSVPPPPPPPVPEPTSLMLLGGGALGLVAARRRK
jgi:PEP-CTERM motif-containing protein